MLIYNVKKTLYIIRHGETEFNRLNIVQGSGVDTSLNESGRFQARKFYDAYQDLNFDKIYTSALKRSRESVQLFIDRGIPVESLKELNEISWGRFEGKTQTAEQRAMYQKTVDLWNLGDEHARISEGESPAELRARQLTALDHIMNKPGEEKVLICMHGRAMKSFLCLLMDEPISKMEEFPHTNLGLYVLEYEDNRFHLRMKNNISHL